MIGNKFQVDSRYLVVGPIDRLIRGGIGLLILLVTYKLHMTMDKFLILHVIVCFFWLTALTGWDPFYLLVKRVWEAYKDHAAISGRFK